MQIAIPQEKSWTVYLGRDGIRRLVDHPSQSLPHVCADRQSRCWLPVCVIEIFALVLCWVRLLHFSASNNNPIPSEIRA